MREKIRTTRIGDHSFGEWNMPEVLITPASFQQFIVLYLHGDLFLLHNTPQISRIDMDEESIAKFWSGLRRTKSTKLGFERRIGGMKIEERDGDNLKQNLVELTPLTSFLDNDISEREFIILVHLNLEYAKLQLHGERTFKFLLCIIRMTNTPSSLKLLFTLQSLLCIS